jgi:hypothetical protein
MQAGKTRLSETVSQPLSPLRGSDLFSTLPRGLRPGLTALPPLCGSFDRLSTGWFHCKIFGPIATHSL